MSLAVGTSHMHYRPTFPACFLALLPLLACSSTPPDVSPQHDAGAPDRDAGGEGGGHDGGTHDGGTHDGGGGGDAGPTCAGPTTPPSMACGTLAWAESASKSRKRNHHVTLLPEVQAGPFVYAMGGFDGMVTAYANVDRAPIAADGTVGSWVSETPLPMAMGGFTGVVVSNSLFVIAGGMEANGTITDQSFTSVIAADGTLGAWQPAGSTQHPRMHGGQIVNGDTVYVLGGFSDPNVWDDVVRATVSPSGTLSAWTSAGKLPGPRSHFSISLVDGYVYITGGLDVSAFQNPPNLTEVARAQIAADGTVGPWTTLNPLPVALATHASFVYGGYLYVGGGISGTTDPIQEKRVWRAPIEADHTLGAWEIAAPLHIARSHVHQLPMYVNHVYSVSGSIDLNLVATDEIDVGSFE